MIPEAKNAKVKLYWMMTTIRERSQRATETTRNSQTHWKIKAPNLTPEEIFSPSFFLADTGFLESDS
jgi:hypothetical protein